MSSFTVIAGVTRTLSQFLNGATGITVDHDRAPNASIPDTAPLIHLYLYRVEINPFFTNNDWLEPSAGALQDPPIGLNLLYLVTPYGNGQIELQTTLGEVIKVFHETPIIPPSAFDPVLVDTTEELRVLPRKVRLQELTEFWRSFEQRSYRLSLAYEASAVLIDSEVSREVTRVEERHLVVEQLR